MKTRAIAAIPVLLMLTNNAIAFECFEESLQLQAMPTDAYYTSPEPIELSKSEQKAFATFVRRMHGEWETTFTSDICFGTKNNPHRQLKEAEGSIIMSASKESVLHARLEVLYSLDNIIGTEVIDLITPGTMTELSVSKDELIASHRQWINRELVEQIIRITRSGKRYHINLSRFEIGEFMYSQSIDFKIK